MYKNFFYSRFYILVKFPSVCGQDLSFDLANNNNGGTDDVGEILQQPKSTDQTGLTSASRYRRPEDADFKDAAVDNNSARYIYVYNQLSTSHL